MGYKPLIHGESIGFACNVTVVITLIFILIALGLCMAFNKGQALVLNLQYKQ